MRASIPLSLLGLIGCGAPQGSYVPADYAPSDPGLVVFMGDSITDVEQEEEEDAREYPMYPELLVENDDVAWPDAADQDLESAFQRELQAINVAVGGSVAADLPEQLAALDAQLGEAPLEGEALVVITIGGNDVSEVAVRPGMGRAAGAGVVERVGEVMTYFEDTARFPDGAYVYVANVYDPTGAGNASGGGCWPRWQGPLLNEVVSGINAAMSAGGQERGFAVLDMYGLFLDHGFGRDDPEAGAEPAHWFEDCVHPNARGHHEIRGMFFRAITGQEVDTY